VINLEPRPLSNISEGVPQPVEVTTLPGRPDGLGLSVSPDERYLLFTKPDDSGTEPAARERFSLRASVTISGACVWRAPAVGLPASTLVSSREGCRRLSTGD
jgi:hypothetical protein